VEDDGLTFLADTIRIEKIRDEEAYEGIRVLLEARLANARIPLQIDVGFGDVITPEPMEVEYPAMLAFPKAKMRAHPKETVVAEKFEALIKLGMANSRMKAFYDLWVMAGSFEFSGAVLAEALSATFERPKTLLPASRSLAFTREFSASPAKQTQWMDFLPKSGLEADASLQE
jgi:Nucleotidyl transferase AbiEii toxin, Type IV TA system